MVQHAVEHHVPADVHPVPQGRRDEDTALLIQWTFRHSGNKIANKPAKILRHVPFVDLPDEFFLRRFPRGQGIDLEAILPVGGNERVGVVLLAQHIPEAGRYVQPPLGVETMFRLTSKPLH